MSELDTAVREFIDARQQFERAWDSTDGVWGDAQRDEFDGTIVFPLVRGASDLAREMEAISSVVQSALAKLGS